MPLFGTAALIPGTNPIVNGTNGRLLFNNAGFLGELDPATFATPQDIEDALGESGFVVVDVAEGQIPVGQSDGSLAGSAALRFTDAEGLAILNDLGSGFFMGSAGLPNIISFGYAGDGSSSGLSFEVPGGGVDLIATPEFAFRVAARTTTDANTDSPDFVLGVHTQEANAAEFRVTLRGDEGPTPSTTISAPGSVTITANGDILFISDVEDENAFNVWNPTGDVRVRYTAGDEEVDGNIFQFFVRHSGTTFEQFSPLGPLPMSFAGASGYSFDATVSATAFTVNGNAGFTGTALPTSTLTIEGGIITAVT